MDTYLLRILKYKLISEWCNKCLSKFECFTVLLPSRWTWDVLCWGDRLSAGFADVLRQITFRNFPRFNFYSNFRPLGRVLVFEFGSSHHENTFWKNEMKIWKSAKGALLLVTTAIFPRNSVIRRYFALSYCRCRVASFFRRSMRRYHGKALEKSSAWKPSSDVTYDGPSFK